jgi:hypothetical protein
MKTITEQKQQFDRFRPVSFIGEGDKYLFPLIQELNKLIPLLEKKYAYKAVKLDKTQTFIMANLLIEFAEDLHNNIGFWRSIEEYNNLMFNTPLPLFVAENTTITDCFDKNRIKFFIYTLFCEFDPDLILPPTQSDLEILATGVSKFLTEKFANVPKDSGIKQFLSQPNDYGWEFKRKLVWTGQNCYLFRYSCYRYANERNEGKMDIETIDDFICQETTYWSGLGLIDILSKCLRLPQNIERDVRTWYERLVSYYRVVSNKNQILELENLVNKQIYKILSDGDVSMFKKDGVIFGGIVPYGDYFVWSGVQKNFGKVNNANMELELNDFIHRASRIVFRYDKQLLSEAVESINMQYVEFKTYFKSDLMVFKNGKEMEKALIDKEKLRYSTLSKSELNDFMTKHNLKDAYPKINFPDHLLNSKHSVAIYFNPDEGMEIMTYYDLLISGLNKKGRYLTSDEQETIIGLIESDSISPKFVKNLMQEYGEKSIAAVYLLNPSFSCVDYLLHKYKGHYFRNRYPSISLKMD